MTGDFSQVVDGTVAVKLKRRHGGTVDVARAWRFSQTVVEPTATGGYVATTDTVWQFEWPADTPPPRLGDRLIDEQGTCGVIRRVERGGGNTRWRVLVRGLAIAWGLDQQVAIERAEWGGDPLQIVGWQLVDPAVPARLQPQVAVADHTTAPPTTTQQFRATIDTPHLLDGDHRLVAADGTTYRVLQFEGADDIDRLPVAVVELQSDL
jgi:hypothetical protein